MQRGDPGDGFPRRESHHNIVNTDADVIENVFDFPDHTDEVLNDLHTGFKRIFDGRFVVDHPRVQLVDLVPDGVNRRFQTVDAVFGGAAEQGRKNVRAQPGERRLHVLDGSGNRVPGGFRRPGRELLNHILQLLDADLAVRNCFRDIDLRAIHLVQPRFDRQIHQLVLQQPCIQLALIDDLGERLTDPGNIVPGERGSIGHIRHVFFDVGDTGGDGVRRLGERIRQRIRCALNGSLDIFHRLRHVHPGLAELNERLVQVSQPLIRRIQRLITFKPFKQGVAGGAYRGTGRRSERGTKSFTGQRPRLRCHTLIPGEGLLQRPDTRQRRRQLRAERLTETLTRRPTVLRKLFGDVLPGAGTRLTDALLKLGLELRRVRDNRNVSNAQVDAVSHRRPSCSFRDAVSCAACAPPNPRARSAPNPDRAPAVSPACPPAV